MTNRKEGGVFFFSFLLLLLLFCSSFCLFSLSPLFSLRSACIVWFGLYGLYCLISLNGRTKKIFQLVYKSCKTKAKIVFWTLVWMRTLFTDICSWTPFTTYIWTWAWTAFDRSGASSMFMKTVHEHIHNEHEPLSVPAKVMNKLVIGIIGWTDCSNLRRHLDVRMRVRSKHYTIVLMCKVHAKREICLLQMDRCPVTNEHCLVRLGKTKRLPPHNQALAQKLVQELNAHLRIPHMRFSVCAEDHASAPQFVVELLELCWRDHAPSDCHKGGIQMAVTPCQGCEGSGMAPCCWRCNLNWSLHLGITQTPFMNICWGTPFTNIWDIPVPSRLYCHTHCWPWWSSPLKCWTKLRSDPLNRNANHRLPGRVF